MKHIVFGIVLAASGFGIASPATEKKTVDGVIYHVLRVAPSAVRIIWTDKEGKPLRTFRAAARFLRESGEEPLTLMNGGIFEPGGIPSGLLIQNGKKLRPVNRRAGKGNFFLKPNGIFLVGSRGAAVIGTNDYPLKDTRVQFAVQSGPLLLRRGKVHPRFNAGSDSRLIRNGVGVAKSGEVVLAVTDFHSEKLPNLFEFAELFRKLGCENALFLDGDLSQMRSGPALDRQSNRFGSIIAIIAKR